MRLGYSEQFVIADIPGLIEGAHEGIGLGHEFLRHVERTRAFVHLIEPEPMDGSDPLNNYRNIREELRLYDPSLMDRPELVVVTKAELAGAEDTAILLSEEIGKPVMLISAVTGKGLPDLTKKIFDLLNPDVDTWQPPVEKSYE